MSNKTTNLDLVKLSEILKSLKEEEAIHKISQKLNLAQDSTTTKQLAGAIRLAGYKVYSKTKWDAEQQKVISLRMVEPLKSR